MIEIIRQHKDFGVAIEKEDGPEPGRPVYHLVVDGARTESTTVLSLAEVLYKEQCDERAGPARARLAREMAHRDIQGVRSDAFERRAAQGRAKGGRGGRGGV